MSDHLMLVVDDRERAVFKAIENTKTNHKIERITVGDYALIDLETDRIIAVFERKTLCDFGASLKDGRHANRQKMLALRAETGCAVFYIIEGNAFPSARSFFSGIAYKNIESACFHMMVSEQIMFMYSKNADHTAELLARFVTSMANLKATEQATARATARALTRSLTKAISEADSNLVDCSADCQLETDCTTGAAEAALKMVVVRSDIDVLRTIWSVFRGVSVVTADMLIGSFTIVDILSSTKPQLEEWRSPDNRRIAKNVIKSLTCMSPLVQQKLIAAVPGVSMATAKELLQSAGCAASLLSLPMAEIAVIKVGKAQRQFGLVKSRAIVHFMTNQPN